MPIWTTPPSSSFHLQIQCEGRFTNLSLGRTSYLGWQYFWRSTLLWCRWFERFIFFCIVVNIATLAAYNPIEGLEEDPSPMVPIEEPSFPLDPAAPIPSVPVPDSQTPDEPPESAPPSTSNKLTRNQIIDIIDYVLLGIYTVELLLKWFALGLVLHPRAYFRSPWNVIDFIVVLTSYIAIGYGQVFAVFKIARIFRPLKLVAGIPSTLFVEADRVGRCVSLSRCRIKEHGSSYGKINAIPVERDHTHVSILLCVWYNWCWDVWRSVPSSLPRQRHMFVSWFSSAWLLSHLLCTIVEIVDYEAVCRINVAPAWQGGRYCPEGTFCDRTDMNPNVNVTGFDTFPQAALTLFQSVTLEGWVYVGYWVCRSTMLDLISC